VASKKAKTNYATLVEHLFAQNFKAGAKHVDFSRDQINNYADALNMERPRNLGDLVYYFRYRKELPESVRAKASPGKEWAIVGIGDAKYRFQQFSAARITPRTDQEAVKIPRATPEIVTRYARSEEQALLAVVRYNRLVDIFLGVTAYSLQSHLRTNVAGMGQIEIDEVYLGLNKQGAQFIIPVQAKGGKDQQGIVQVLQDAEFCKLTFPDLVPRLVAAQFIADDHVAMLELTVTDAGVKVRNEQHYQLVEASKIKADDLKSYRAATKD